MFKYIVLYIRIRTMVDIVELAKHTLYARYGNVSGTKKLSYYNKFLVAQKQNRGPSD